jgi:hypothetical protein
MYSTGNNLRTNHKHHINTEIDRRELFCDWLKDDVFLDIIFQNGFYMNFALALGRK